VIREIGDWESYIYRGKKLGQGWEMLGFFLDFRGLMGCWSGGKDGF